MWPSGTVLPPRIVGTIETPLGPRPFLLHTQDAVLELDRIDAGSGDIAPSLKRAPLLESRIRHLAEMSVQDAVWRVHVGRYCCRRCSTWVDASEAATWRNGRCQRCAAAD